MPIPGSTDLKPSETDDRPQPGPDIMDAGLWAVWANAAIGLFRSSPDGRQFRANPALLRMLGYRTEGDRQTVLPRDWPQDWYAEPDRRAEFRRLMEEQGSVTDFRSRIRRLDTGSLIWVSETAWVIRDETGAPLCYEGTVTDITDQMAVIEALKRREECLRDFADISCDWYWETGPDHRFTYISEGIRNFGIDPASQIGRTRFDCAEDPADPALADHRAVLDAHQPFRDFVYRIRTADGTELYLSVNGKPVFDAAGRFLGYRGITREINEQVRAREQIRNAWCRAEEASRAKSEFLANMSHELRTPLNAIIGFAEAMRNGLVPIDKAAVYARYIQESGEHLLYLINDILDMSKIVAGRLRLELEAVDAAELIERSAAMFELRAEQGGVTLEHETEPGLPALYGDRVRLGQILVNLISNAVKFTDAGGRITVRCRRHDDSRAVIEVTDTGIGMSPDEVTTAMEPFGQVKRGGGGRRHEGTGLGLPIVRSLIELHGGQMMIDSVRGQGTRIGLVLPLHGQSPSARTRNGPS